MECGKAVSGVVYGLGVGPGDPELITMKALRLLRSVPVIAYPIQDDGTSLARAIVESHIVAGTIEVPIHTPMGERGAAEPGYEQAAVEMMRHLEAGRDVGVLCEGDPLFYGSFMYLLGRLAERHRVEVVPGVCSLTACPAVLGLPLAGRNDVLTVLPGPLPDDRLRRGLAGADTTAILKVGRHLPRIRALLDELGLTGRAHYVERATQAGQKVLPLAAVDTARATYFSMILVYREGHLA
jgi:precorrin-2/cobalt-factor-2 C20-methyltransferase